MRTTIATILLPALTACGSVEEWWNGLPENATRQPDGTWIGTENICWRGGAMYDTPG